MAPEDGHHAFHEDASHPHVGLRGLLVLVSAHDWQAGGPYVMWKGTPYAHIMMPVD